MSRPTAWAPRPTGRSRTTALLTIAALVALTAVLLVVFVLRLASSPDAEVNLGDEVFRVGEARHLTTRIDRGGPLLFQDLAGGDRDLWVQHVEEDARTGWHAFEAHAPGAPRRCQLRWRPAARDFLDPCDGRTYPAHGRGLTSYPARLDGEGTVVVRLSSPRS